MDIRGARICAGSYSDGEQRISYLACEPFSFNVDFICDAYRYKFLSQLANTNQLVLV